MSKELLETLTQILAVQREQLAVLKELRDGRSASPLTRSATKASKQAAPAAKPLGGEVASDRELDGPYGDPQIKKSPPRWDGFDFAGQPMSQCDPEFLDAFAAFKDWQAEHPREGDDPKWARYAKKDAALARGWAARLRNGWKAPGAAEPEQAPMYGDEDEIPF